MVEHLERKNKTDAHKHYPQFPVQNLYTQNMIENKTQRQVFHINVAIKVMAKFYVTVS